MSKKIMPSSKSIQRPNGSNELSEIYKMLSNLSENISSEISAESSPASRDQHGRCRRSRTVSQKSLKSHNHEDLDEGEEGDSEDSDAEPARPPSSKNRPESASPCRVRTLCFRRDSRINHSSINYSAAKDPSTNTSRSGKLCLRKDSSNNTSRCAVPKDRFDTKDLSRTDSTNCTRSSAKDRRSNCSPSAPKESNIASTRSVTKDSSSNCTQLDFNIEKINSGNCTKCVKVGINTCASNEDTHTTNGRIVAAEGRVRCSSESVIIDLNKYKIKSSESRNGEIDGSQNSVADCIDNARIEARKRQSSMCTEEEYRLNQSRLAKLQSSRDQTTYRPQSNAKLFQQSEHLVHSNNIATTAMGASRSKTPKPESMQYEGKSEYERNFQGLQTRNKTAIKTVALDNAATSLELNQAADHRAVSLSQASRACTDYRRSKSSAPTKHSDLTHPETLYENVSSTNSSRDGKQANRDLFTSSRSASLDSQNCTSADNYNRRHSDFGFNNRSDSCRNSVGTETNEELVTSYRAYSANSTNVSSLDECNRRGDNVSNKCSENCRECDKTQIHCHQMLSNFTNHGVNYDYENFQRSVLDGTNSTCIVNICADTDLQSQNKKKNHQKLSTVNKGPCNHRLNTCNGCEIIDQYQPGFKTGTNGDIIRGCAGANEELNGSTSYSIAAEKPNTYPDQESVESIEQFTGSKATLDSLRADSMAEYCKTSKEDKLSDYEDILDVHPHESSPEILQGIENDRSERIVKSLASYGKCTNQDDSAVVMVACNDEKQGEISMLYSSEQVIDHTSAFFKNSDYNFNGSHLSSAKLHQNAEHLFDSSYQMVATQEMHEFATIESLDYPVELMTECEHSFPMAVSNSRYHSNDKPRMGVESVYAKASGNRVGKVNAPLSNETGNGEASLYYASTNLLDGKFEHFDISLTNNVQNGHMILQPDSVKNKSSQSNGSRICFAEDSILQNQRTDDSAKNAFFNSSPQLGGSKPHAANGVGHNFNTRCLSCPDSEIHANAELRERKHRSVIRRALSAIASHLSLSKRRSKLVRAKSSVESDSGKDRLVRKYSAPPRFAPYDPLDTSEKKDWMEYQNNHDSPPHLREKYSIPFSPGFKEHGTFQHCSVDFSHNGIISRSSDRNFTQADNTASSHLAGTSFNEQKGKIVTANYHISSSNDENSRSMTSKGNNRNQNAVLLPNGGVFSTPESQQVQLKSDATIVFTGNSCKSDINSHHLLIERRENFAKSKHKVSNLATVQDIIRSQTPECSIDFERALPAECADSDNISICSRYDNVLESENSLNPRGIAVTKHSNITNISKAGKKLVQPQVILQNEAENTIQQESTNVLLQRNSNVPQSSVLQSAPNKGAAKDSANHREFTQISASSMPASKLAMPGSINASKSHMVVERALSQGATGVVKNVGSDWFFCKPSEKSNLRRLRSDNSHMSPSQRKPLGFDRIRTSVKSSETDNCASVNIPRKVISQNEQLVKEPEILRRPSASKIEDKPAPQKSDDKQSVVIGAQITVHNEQSIEENAISRKTSAPKNTEFSTPNKPREIKSIDVLHTHDSQSTQLQPIATVRDVISRSILAPNPNPNPAQPSHSAHNLVFRYPDPNKRSSSSGEESEGEFFGSSFETNISLKKTPTRDPDGGEHGRKRLASTIREIILDNFEFTMTSPMVEGRDVESVCQKDDCPISLSRQRHRSKSESTYNTSQTAAAVSQFLQRLSESEWTTFGSLINSFITCAQLSLNSERLQIDAQQFTRGLYNYLLNGNDRDFNHFLRENYPLMTLDDSSVREGIKAALRKTVRVHQLHRPTSIV